MPELFSYSDSSFGPVLPFLFLSVYVLLVSTVSPLLNPATCRTQPMRRFLLLPCRSYRRQSLFAGSLSTSTGTSLGEMNDYTLFQLQDRLQNYMGNEDKSPVKLSLVIAGGGSTFLSTLGATPGASSLLSEGTLTYSRESFMDYANLPTEPSQYTSIAAAELLSSAACSRALRLATRAPGHDLRNCIGISCSSVLRSLESRPRGGSRAFLSLCTSDCARKLTVIAKLSANASRTRFDEDVFLGHCLMSMLEFASGVTDGYQLHGVQFEDKDEAQDDIRVTKGSTGIGDELEARIEAPSPTTADTVLSSLERAAERILSGNEESVMLLPNPSEDSFDVIHSVHLPPDCLVFPGSFNPPHTGHIALAIASAKAMERCNAIYFELSITNPDKNSLDAQDVARRVQHFLELRHELPKETRWGILLTDASLFKRKVDLMLPKLVDPNGSLTFCIGTDTLVRIIDPKYYHKSEEAMFSALRSMKCRFVVGGRLDQKRKVGAEFMTGQREIDELPPDLRDKFITLSDFRVDLSSSEIRAKQGL